MGERVVRNHEVRGSIPLFSTRTKAGRAYAQPAFNFMFRFDYIIYILATPVSLAACATAFAMASLTRGSNAFGMM